MYIHYFTAIYIYTCVCVSAIGAIASYYNKNTVTMYMPYLTSNFLTLIGSLI